VSVSIFVAATMLFLLIPRIGFGLFFQKSRSPVNMTGFSDGVQLGGHGLIKNDDTVVMRVHIDDKYHGRNAPYIHWRGVAFDLYENGEWRRSREAPKTERRVVIPRRGMTRHHLLYNQRNIEPNVLDARMRRSVRQEVYLEPTGYDVLFGASMPMTFEFESSQRRPRKERNDEIRHHHSAGIKYVVYSDLDPPSSARMRKALDVVPVGFDVYLDVPSDVPNRVIELAQRITRDAETKYDKVKAIETWLKTNLAYTLRMQDPEGQEPIDFFLFDRKAGHCEYFSSAMAIMVRSVGVPSRNVNGFLGGEWNEYNDYIAVRAGDAHSWVEVYFHDVGWVTFDPTPSAEVDQLGRGGLSFVDKMRRIADTIRFKWFKWVIEYDFFRQMSLFRKVSRGLKRGAGGFLKGGPSRIKDWFKRNKAKGMVAVGAFGLLFAGFLLWRRRHQTADEQLGRRTSGRRRRSPVSGIYASVLSRLAKRGYKRSPSTTPREHAHALAELEVPGSAELVELTDLYYSVEFGGRAAGDALGRARELRGAIESALKTAKHRGQATA
ncbi:MAG: DUF3488 and transglutaminase-like domain-containing protein, partial [Deltaproteobacteria bacterium]|nr:DUF3488 and transglutaminase-like domain-containing protein [Deltaproteobacteria bacterium]